MACAVMAYMIMAYTVMAYIVMAYIVMAHIVMAHIVMVYDGSVPSTPCFILIQFSVSVKASHAHNTHRCSQTSVHDGIVFVHWEIQFSNHRNSVASPQRGHSQNNHLRDQDIKQKNAQLHSVDRKPVKQSCVQCGQLCLQRQMHWTDGVCTGLLPEVLFVHDQRRKVALCSSALRRIYPEHFY